MSSSAGLSAAKRRRTRGETKPEPEPEPLNDRNVSLKEVVLLHETIIHKNNKENIKKMDLLDTKIKEIDERLNDDLNEFLIMMEEKNSKLKSLEEQMKKNDSIISKLKMDVETLSEQLMSRINISETDSDESDDSVVKPMENLEVND